MLFISWSIFFRALVAKRLSLFIGEGGYATRAIERHVQINVSTYSWPSHGVMVSLTILYNGYGEITAFSCSLNCCTKFLGPPWSHSGTINMVATAWVSCGIILALHLHNVFTGLVKYYFSNCLWRI